MAHPLINQITLSSIHFRMPGLRYPSVATNAPSIQVSNLIHKTNKITAPGLLDCCSYNGHLLKFCTYKARNGSRSLRDYISDSCIGPLCCDYRIDALTPQCGSTLGISNRENFLPCSHQTKT
jgi:hypothetical protein